MTDDQCQLTELAMAYEPEVFRWDIGKTFELVGARFGKQQVDIARPSVKSIDTRLAFAAYHFREILRVLNEFRAEHLFEDTHLWQVIYGRDEKSHDSYRQAMLATSAHATACIQAMHAVPDILSNAVFFSTALNAVSKPLDPRAVSIGSIAKEVAKHDWLQSLIAPLSAITEGEPYAHLSALSNASKHSAVTRLELVREQAGERPRPYVLMLNSVSKSTKEGAKTFPTAPFEKFALSEHARLLHAVQEVGAQLNAALKS